jgi:hypothetical protein
MIPFILAAVGGYLIGDSIKASKTFAEGGLIAPNGKPSNLTPEQYKLVRTPEFKAWFGDWENDPENASKVVDENGEPKVVYHYSNNNFSEFRKDKIIWITPDKEYGQKMKNLVGENTFELFVNAKKIIDLSRYGYKFYDQKSAYELLLKYGIDAPSILTHRSGAIFYSFIQFFQDEIKSKLTNIGYDGIKVKVHKNYDYSYAVFEPNQIKLADGSNTTFDSTNPDIRYDGGGIIFYQDFAPRVRKFKIEEPIFYEADRLTQVEAKIIGKVDDKKVKIEILEDYIPKKNIQISGRKKGDFTNMITYGMAKEEFAFDEKNVVKRGKIKIVNQEKINPIDGYMPVNYIPQSKEFQDFFNDNYEKKNGRWFKILMADGGMTSNTKKVKIYKAISGYYFASFTVKGKSKPRIIPLGTTEEEVKDAIKRYRAKGYLVKNDTKKFAEGGMADDVMPKGDIIKYVKDNSYFDYEGEENGILQFSTRKNGSVLNETASNIDILEGKKLKIKILENFNKIDVKLEAVDEYVLIFISEIKEKLDEFRYIFIKDYNGQGFSEGYKTMDELIKKRGDWIDVDWELIKNKIDSINNFTDNKFTGWYGSNRMLIKGAGEEGNDWGYNFYIQKDKKID